MEFFYYCATCTHHNHNVPKGLPMAERWRQWCMHHERELPKEVNMEQLICCDFVPKDLRATEWKPVIKKFPKGELWSCELYRPSRKFAVISDLPKINPEAGDVVES